jgi:HD-GYP domain-containing protein (c-di-GMP phosphodiesterase class II)
MFCLLEPLSTRTLRIRKTVSTAPCRRRDGRIRVGEGVHVTRDWLARPAASVAVRLAAYVVPVVAAIGAGIAVSVVLPTPSTAAALVLWWGAVVSIAVAALFVTDVVISRPLLPLAMLLRLSMVFPDHAPSRWSVAHRVRGRRAVARELDRARRHGIDGSPQAAAETVLAVVAALDDHDRRRRGHAERTHLYVSSLADKLGLSAADRGRLLWVALAHDIGKVKVPQSVLGAPQTPTDPEWRLLRAHPINGAELCSPLREWLGEWWPAIEQHHEQFDGSGYPLGLAGRDINYGARIIAVADSFDTMTAAQSYRRPISADAALWELMRGAGTQFDPAIVSAFIRASGRGSGVPAAVAVALQRVLVRPGRAVASALAAVSAALAAVAVVALLSLAPSLPADAGQGRHQAGPGRPGHTGHSTGPTTLPTKRPPTAPPTKRPPTTPTPTKQPSTTPTSDPGPTSAPRTPPPVSPTPVAWPAINTPPTAHDDRVSVPEDSHVPLRLRANDSDADGDPLAVVFVRGARHGAISWRRSGACMYTPDRDFNGVDRLRYRLSDGQGGSATATVRVRIRGVNDRPVIAPAAYATTTRHRLVVNAAGGVLANVADVDGDRLRVVRDSSRAVRVRPNGSISLRSATPGTRKVRYVVSDGHTAVPGHFTITVSSQPLERRPLYLGRADTDRIGALRPRRPSTRLTDWDHDGHPGLTIRSSRLVERSKRPGRFQLWDYHIPSQGLELAGPVRLAVSTFLGRATDRDVEYAAWLYDCRQAHHCHRVLASSPVRVVGWGVEEGWSRHVLTLGAVEARIAPGHTLRLRVMVNGADLWVRSDADHPATLTVTTR